MKKVPFEAQSNEPPAEPSSLVGVVVNGRINAHDEPEFPLTEPEWLIAPIDPGPPPLRPDDSGFMALTAAAHWIASQGGNRSIGGNASLWRSAYEQLRAAVTEGTAKIYGLRNGETIKDREPIPPATFIGLKIFYPLDEVDFGDYFGDEAFLQCRLYLDERSWRDSGGDQIFERGTGCPPIWSRLEVDTAAVDRLCPVLTAKLKPPSPQQLKKFVADYGKSEKAAKRAPTQKRLLVAAKSDLPTATRKVLIAEFNSQFSVVSGRPKKSPEKSP
jgi:hypothetical protein